LLVRIRGLICSFSDCFEALVFSGGPRANPAILQRFPPPSAARLSFFSIFFCVSDPPAFVLALPPFPSSISHTLIGILYGSENFPSVTPHYLTREPIRLPHAISFYPLSFLFCRYLCSILITGNLQTFFSHSCFVFMGAISMLYPRLTRMRLIYRFSSSLTSSLSCLELEVFDILLLPRLHPTPFGPWIFLR